MFRTLLFCYNGERTVGGAVHCQVTQADGIVVAKSDPFVGRMRLDATNETAAVKTFRRDFANGTQRAVGAPSEGTPRGVAVYVRTRIGGVPFFYTLLDIG